MVKFLILMPLCLMAMSINAEFLDFPSDTIELEKKVEFYTKSLILGNKNIDDNGHAFWSFNKKEDSMALTDALWSQGWQSEDPHLRKKVKDYLGTLNLHSFYPADQIRLFLLGENLGRPMVHNSNLVKRIYRLARRNGLNRRAIFTLLNYRDLLVPHGFKEVFEEITYQYKDDYQTYQEATAVFRPKTKDELKDLVSYEKGAKVYKNGHYSDGVKIFMFCRRKRNYPCLMMMKDRDNQFVTNASGEYWSQNALGYARRNRRFNVKNGNTPSGIFTIDSVMPKANKKRVFGKYRRLILNFVRSSNNERQLKKLLPESAHDRAWWKESVIARDIGRNLFRVHGTGRKNRRPSSSYYPFVKTSGCVAQKENTYQGVTYRDQRELLDEMMVSSGLIPTFDNEKRLKGILYIIDIDNKEEIVQLEELKNLLDL